MGAYPPHFWVRAFPPLILTIKNGNFNFSTLSSKFGLLKKGFFSTILTAIQFLIDRTARLCLTRIFDLTKLTRKSTNSFANWRTYLGLTLSQFHSPIGEFSPKLRQKMGRFLTVIWRFIFFSGAASWATRDGLRPIAGDPLFFFSRFLLRFGRIRKGGKYKWFKSHLFSPHFHYFTVRVKLCHFYPD